MSFKPLPIGIDNFEMLITRGYYFIDKTLLIKDFFESALKTNSSLEFAVITGCLRISKERNLKM